MSLRILSSPAIECDTVEEILAVLRGLASTTAPRARALPAPKVQGAGGRKWTAERRARFLATMRKKAHARDGQAAVARVNRVDLIRERAEQRKAGTP